MAIVKLGRKVKTNLPGTLAYVINPAKTDGGRFVYASYSGERQDAGKLAGPMILDLESCANGMREGSVLALHLKHSFAPDENVTPERVHEMGIALAEAITGGEYRYVVSTHLDRNHLHNHIVICTANRRTRRKMRLTRRSIDQWRAISDELCRREGLATLDNPSVEAETERIDMQRIMERTPGQESTAVPSASSKVVPMNGRGVSMEELYAIAKGKGMKEQLRAVIEIAAAMSGSYGEFESNIAVAHVGVALRGRHLTYTDLDTGLKVRDTRLGPAYDLDSVMARIGGGRTIHLTFNQRLVSSVGERAVRVWMPGTQRARKAVIPTEMLARDGNTWHLFLPSDHHVTLLDRSNRYAGRVGADDLADEFGRPERRLEPLTTDRRLFVRHGITPAQQRYYQAQARRLDELRAAADGLNEAIRVRREADGDMRRGMRDLVARIDTARDELRSTVIALSEAIANGDDDLAIETQKEMRQREQTLERCEARYWTIIQGARLAGIDVSGLGVTGINRAAMEKETGDGTGERDPNGRDGRQSGKQTIGAVDAGIPGRGRRDDVRPRFADRAEQGTPTAAGSGWGGKDEALIKQSEAQEAAFRAQRDQQEAERSQSKGEGMRRKGSAL
ncbi:relaxase [Bifidobacteriaceae bacterium MCC02031]|nr:relaxase [Bifidobacteriaceae bacterium MCC02031]